MKIFKKLKSEKKLRKKTESTRVNSTNPPLTTLDEDKKNRLPKEEPNKEKTKVKKKLLSKKMQVNPG
jgi:hypothetical protein